MIATLPVMDRRPPRVRDGQDLWQKNQTPCLGCSKCQDYDLCGALAVDKPIISCMDFCTCTDPTTCDNVCPRNAAHYVARKREVRGFDLDNVAPVPAAATPVLPEIVPEVFHGNRRSSAIELPAVAIPLRHVFHARSGHLRFLARGNIESVFRVRPGLLILDGVAEDQHLENYWGTGRAAGLAEALTVLKPDLITVPNFSLFTDVPRWDNFYNMKRIAICWSELQAAGNAVALHVNARTNQDYTRWGEFLRDHPEITWLAFEFATGAGTAQRGPWHRAQLQRLIDQARRPLSIVVRGGRKHLPELRRTFDAVTFVSADPFMKTMKRQRLHFIQERGRWVRTMTLLGQPLDELLASNIASFERMLGPDFNDAAKKQSRASFGSSLQQNPLPLRVAAVGNSVSKQVITAAGG